VEKVAKCLAPNNWKEVRQFLENYFHQFVRNYSAVAKPLTVLTSPGQFFFFVVLSHFSQVVGSF